MSLLIVSLITVSPAPVEAREQASLETCIALTKKIERYTRLRRGGGTAQQMERWRDARRGYEDKFTNLRCRRFGRKLRSTE